MKIIRTIKLKHLNGEFDEKETYFFSFFDNLQEEHNSMFGEDGYARFSFNKWNNIFWMDYDKGFKQYCEKYDIHPLDASDEITSMIKKHLGLQVKLSTWMPEEYEEFEDDFYYNAH